jgi:hypothetical protein
MRTRIHTAGAAAALALLLAGCGPEPAPYVSTPLPDIPAECRVREAICPREPKLPKGDVTGGRVTTDRTALKSWGRCNEHYRRVCEARLQVLLAPTNAQ